MSERKTEFWWASVAGAKTEPLEVTELDGERVAYSLGCQDPFWLDRSGCPADLIQPLGQRPMNRKERDVYEEERVRLARHHWRGDR